MDRSRYGQNAFKKVTVTLTFDLPSLQHNPCVKFEDFRSRVPDTVTRREDTEDNPKNSFYASIYCRRRGIKTLFICAGAQYSCVCICSYTQPHSLFWKANWIICCDTGDFKQLQKTAPPLPIHKTHPLDLKSKQSKWLDEIRATLLAVKLNRICACWFEDLHTILSTPERGEETKHTAPNDFWQ